jgi:uncharacterized protein with GYD domain
LITPPAATEALPGIAAALARVIDFGLDAATVAGAVLAIADRRRAQPARGARIQPKRGGFAMPTYVLLGNFTEQGIRTIKDTPKRLDAVKKIAKQLGVTVTQQYWTLGQYDIVAVLEAPDDAAITAFGLGVGKIGNVRTQTLRAYDAQGMKAILGKVK